MLPVVSAGLPWGRSVADRLASPKGILNLLWWLLGDDPPGMGLPGPVAYHYLVGGGLKCLQLILPTCNITATLLR